MNEEKMVEAVETMAEAIVTLAHDMQEIKGLLNVTIEKLENENKKRCVSCKT